MKIKNLLILALLTVCCSAFAQTSEKKDGIWYKVAADGKSATVEGISAKMTDAAAATITIPASFVDGDGNTVPVVGFESTWTAKTGEKNIAALTTSLTVNIANFKAIPAATDFSALTKLATLELKGTSTIDGDIAVPAYNNTIATLKLADLAPKAGKKISYKFDVTALATVTLPTGTDIADGVFSGATKLTSITGAKNIGKQAFKGATALETIAISGTKIGNNAFDGATKLATIDLSAVEEIGNSAFFGTKITTANLAAATKIGQGAFKDVATITSVTLKSTGDANSVEIGDDAFNGLKEVATLTIPATVKYANGTSANGVFANMAKLATLTINNDVIPAAAFTADNAIASLTIANATLASIPFGTFTSTKITVIDLAKCPNVVAAWGSFPANAYTKVKLAGSKTPIANIDIKTNGQTTLKTLTLSEEETFIGYQQFKGFTRLQTVVLPATITYIDQEAFEGSALTAITIPQGADVYQSAFENCKALASVEFAYDPENTATSYIDDYAFKNTAITAVVLPACVTWMGDDVFMDCKELKTFVTQCTKDGSQGITFITSSFDNDEKLKAVVFSKKVSSIDASAFKGLEKLATVTFQHEGKDDAASAPVIAIGTDAFAGTAITSIDLSNTQLTALPAGVFDGCEALATITLPEEMNSLGTNVFRGTAIETLDASMVDGTVGNLFGTSSTTPNNKLKVLKFGNATVATGAFQYCTKLKTLITGAATINPYAFEYDEKLATVTINPYDLDAGTGAYIDIFAFDHCSALTTFNYVPETVDPTEFGSVDTHAFTGCTPFVEFNTTKEFATDYEATYGGSPINTSWTADIVTTIVKTVQDKANPNQFIGKFVSTYPASFDANDAKLYSVYMDGETAYYAACRVDNGKYYVYPGQHVILKTDEAKEISWTVESSMGNSAVGFDDVQSLSVDGELADIQSLLWLQPGQYVYRFTNTEEQGFGFTYYSGKKVKAGQFFVASEKKPEGAGRLNQVWLDEDGNVENDATAIQKIQNTDAENGAIYNLQGVRVQKAQKGLYIQNGKKYVVK